MFISLFCRSTSLDCLYRRFIMKGSNSPLAATQLLKKLQDDDCSVGSARNYTASPVSNARSRQLEGHARHQKESFPSTSVEAELHNLNHTLGTSPLHVDRIMESRSPSLTPRTMDEMSRTNKTKTRQDMNMASWTALDPIAELDRKISRMREAMAKLENETADLSKQTVELKEKSKGLIQLRKSGTKSPLQQVHNTVSSHSPKAYHEDDDEDDDDQGLRGLSFVTPASPSGGPQSLPTPKENSISSLDANSDDVLESISAEVLKLTQQSHETRSMRDDKSSSLYSGNSSKRWRNRGEDKEGESDFSVIVRSPRSETLPRRSLSANRVRSSSSSTSLPSSPASCRPPFPSPSSVSSVSSRRAMSASTTRLGARRNIWGEGGKVLAY